MARERGKSRRIIGGIAFTLLMILVASLAVALVVIPRVLDYETYVITGRSMTGTISIGSLVYSKPVPVTRLRVGDIITFVPPSMDEPVTHRIVGENATPDGERVFTTQGDNVPSADPWNLQIESPQIPRYSAHIPWLGYIVAGLAIRLVRIMLFVIPVMVIAGVLLLRLWKRAGEELEEQDQADAQLRARLGGHDATVGPGGTNQ
jgi:signal peptidase